MGENPLRTVIALAFVVISCGVVAQESSPWDFDPGIPRLDVQSTPPVNGQGPVMWSDNQPLGFRAGQSPFSDQAAPLIRGSEPLPIQTQQIPEPGMMSLLGALGLMIAAGKWRRARSIVKL